MIPTAYEAYDETNIGDLQSEDRQKMFNEIYTDIEETEEYFGDCLDQANNTIAQIIGPFWEKLTDLKSLLEREMYGLPKDEKELD